MAPSLLCQIGRRSHRPVAENWSRSTVSDVSRPLDTRLLDTCVAGCAESHQKLLEVVDSLTPEQLSGPSRLPGWSRLHVVVHLALNAASHEHLLACASRGEHGEQYPGGAVARAAAIDEASRWEPDVAIATLRSSIYRLESAWHGTTYEAWNGTGRAPSGAQLSMHELPFLRWRECVVHLTDLDIGLGYEEWAPAYVRLELDRQKMAWAASHPMGLTLLPQAALVLPDSQRLAWLLQRTEVEGLPIGPGL
jgi:maleylpyruvate isomerase